MTNRRLTAFFPILLVCFGMFYHSACQSGKLSRIAEDIKKSQRPIDFYGKLIDQHGDPVSGARVKIQLKKFSLNPKELNMAVDTHFVETDKHGNFSIKGKLGLDLVISEIKKSGYEYDKRRTLADYERVLTEVMKARRETLEKARADYERALRQGVNQKQAVADLIRVEKDADYDDKYAMPEAPDRIDFQNYKKDKKPKASNPATPALFHMRKKGEQTFVLKMHQGFGFEAGDQVTQAGWDIVADHDIAEKDLARPMFNGQPLTCDLRIKVTQDPKTKVWTVLLSSDHPLNGFNASDQILYEAPAQGYQPTYTFTVDPHKVVKGTNEGKFVFEGTYLYLKSRGTMPLYSRLHLSRIDNHHATEKDIGFGISAVLNPYGERNLEEATDLPWPVFRMVRNEAEEAFRRQSLPAKPDLAQRVREWEKSRPLTEKVKGWFNR